MAFALFTAPFAGSSLYGSKPKVADPGESWQKWLDFTTANLPKTEALGSEINKFNQSEMEKGFETALPGYKDMVAQRSKNTDALLKGEIPLDVQQSLQRMDAFKNIQSGGSGSEAGRNLVARDLGITSLQLMEQGGSQLDAALRWMQSAQAPKFDITSAFLEKDAFFKQQQAQNLIDAAPDPVAVGRFNTEMGYLGMALSMFGGKGYTPTTPNNGSQYLNQGGGGYGNPDSGNGYNNPDFNSNFGGGDGGGSNFNDMGGTDASTSFGDFGSFGFA